MSKLVNFGRIFKTHRVIGKSHYPNLIISALASNNNNVDSNDEMRSDLGRLKDI